MAATLSKLTDAGAAAQYYEAGDDYYTQGGKAPSRWHGRGAEALGLDGEVAPDTFTAMLDGRLPDRTVLGTTRHGVREHKPGWDLTLSAPKSVSCWRWSQATGACSTRRTAPLTPPSPTPSAKRPSPAYATAKR